MIVEDSSKKLNIQNLKQVKGGFQMTKWNNLEVEESMNYCKANLKTGNPIGKVFGGKIFPPLTF